MTAAQRHACLAAATALALAPLLFTRAETAQAPATGMTVPPGFEVELVAGSPLVQRPIVADFDERGRLYVADSSGSNAKVEAQLEERPHRIVRLEDSDGDGRFDKSVVFADRMMFPEGTMWYDGSLYVAAPPSIWKLTDTNDDGVADQREEWFQGKTLTGCANDLHGPYLGPDGWIYWTKGAFAQQTYERGGKPAFVSRASHIFRRRPGTADIEPVMTGGMDNPVDVAFTPAGERILTATFLEHPQLGRRDAIIHAVYGGVYGKPHAVLDGHKRTGDLMPVMAQLGPAVPSGLTRYASRVFGDEYRDSFFATMFNLRKVTRHVLEPDGATFTLRSSDFLVSASRDFHPTDVLEDADGSLLVIDTGPWYKLCCPTSQLAKPDVPGAIYRVRRRGAPAVADPRGQRLAWATMAPPALARLLDDRRPAVQQRAVHELGKRGSSAVAVLKEIVRDSRSAEARRQAVWALTRIDGPDARSAVRLALTDADAAVRQAAMHSAGLWRDPEAAAPLRDALASPAPAVRRAAAEAMGRIKDAQAVPALIDAVAAAPDRVLEHSLTYALIEIGDPAATLSHGERAQSSRTRRAALIAVDQMDGGGLKPESIVPLLDASDPVLKETAWWIAGQHAEWGGALASYFSARLGVQAAAGAAGDDLRDKLAQFAGNPVIQELLGTTVARAASAGQRLTALRAMAASRGRVKQLPQPWIAPLVAALAADPELSRTAVAVVRAVPAAKDSQLELRTALLGAARDRNRPIDLRLEALAAIPDGLATVEADVFDLLQAGLDPAQPALVRATAAAAVERATLNREQLLALSKRISQAGPMELPLLVRAFENGTDEAAGQALVAALRASPGRSALRREQFRAGMAKYPASVQAASDALLASLHEDTMQQRQRLDSLLGTLSDGDIRRGQTVFNSEKAACFSCHAIGYMGGKIGPDLTRIGQVRSERDLLEAIVYPNASFARSYEPFSVRTSSGAVHTGVLRSDLSDEVVLGTAAGEELRIPRRDIADLQPGTVSLMPAGLAEQLTRQELADLLAFLKATRSGAD